MKKKTPKPKKPSAPDYYKSRVRSDAANAGFEAAIYRKLDAEEFIGRFNEKEA